MMRVHIPPLPPNVQSFQQCGFKSHSCHQEYNNFNGVGSNPTAANKSTIISKMWVQIPPLPPNVQSFQQCGFKSHCCHQMYNHFNDLGSNPTIATIYSWFCSRIALPHGYPMWYNLVWSACTALQNSSLLHFDVLVGILKCLRNTSFFILQIQRPPVC